MQQTVEQLHLYCKAICITVIISNTLYSKLKMIRYLYTETCYKIIDT